MQLPLIGAEESGRAEHMRPFSCHQLSAGAGTRSLPGVTYIFNEEESYESEKGFAPPSVFGGHVMHDSDHVAERICYRSAGGK